MIASLPMYDRPETAAANDRLWALIHHNIGIASPPMLTRKNNIWDQWLANDLVISQTCGMPFRTRLHGRVNLVASPTHDLSCAEGHYYSLVIARKSDDRAALQDCQSARFAVNDPLSQSGWAAPQSLAASYGFSFDSTIIPGSHLASAQAGASGKADVAALDAVTWSHICRWDDFASDLKEIAQTPATPALPYITSLGRDPAPIAAALEYAIAELSAQDKAALCLKGISMIPVEDYLAVPTPAPPVNVGAT